MEPSDKIDSLKFLSQTHRDIFHKRRVFEWRIFFTFISIYIASIAALINQKVFVNIIPLWYMILFLSLISIIAILFLGYIHCANLTNKTIAENAEQEIQNIINGIDQPIDLYTKKHAFIHFKGFFQTGKGGAWTWLGESLIILTLLISLLVIICKCI